jgi:hypothetical protein
MTESVKQAVRDRAEQRCEYCRLRQEHLPRERFHIEHVTARKHQGSDEISNLCLACHRCNLCKGTNLSGIDPDGDGAEIVALFHPRRDRWSDHFCFGGASIIGITSVGRTTVWVLNMNEPGRLRLRSLLLANGELD